jgi:hypothetical protein
MGLGLLLPQTSEASFLRFYENRHVPHRSFQVAPELSQVSSKKNYSTQGTLLAPPDLVSYSRLEFAARAEFGLFPDFTAFARLSWVRNHFELSSILGNSFGFADQQVGGNYRVWTGAEDKSSPPSRRYAHAQSVDLQAELHLPLYNNTTLRAGTIPLLGDGSTDFTLGTFFTIPVHFSPSHITRGTAGIGYLSRSEGFSSGLQYSFIVERLPESSGLSLRGGVYGTYALDGQAAQLTTLAGLTSTDAGGSYMIGPLASSLIVARVQGGYQTTGGSDLSLFLAQTLSGRAAPQAFQVGLSYQLYWDGSKATGREPTPPSSRTETSSNRPKVRKGKNSGAFVKYGVTAKVLRANDRLNLVRLDQGSSAGVTTGDRFDIFTKNRDGSTGDRIARGKVTATRANEAALQIEEYFREVWVEQGFEAKKILD